MLAATSKRTSASRRNSPLCPPWRPAVRAGERILSSQPCWPLSPAGMLNQCPSPMGVALGSTPFHPALATHPGLPSTHFYPRSCGCACVRGRARRSGRDSVTTTAVLQPRGHDAISVQPLERRSARLSIPMAPSTVQLRRCIYPHLGQSSAMVPTRLRPGFTTIVDDPLTGGRDVAPSSLIDALPVPSDGCC